MLDPVGAGATAYRNRSIELLLNTAAPTVVRGNGSEIMSVAGANVQTRGVDSGAAANDALSSARALVGRTGGVVCVSGATDHIVDGNRWALLGLGAAVVVGIALVNRPARPG